MAKPGARIVFNRLPELTDLIRARAGQAVRKAALDVEAGAKDRAPVDTGALANSIQMSADGELAATIAVGVAYGIYVEMGTARAAGQPYLVPATEAARPGFEAAMRRIAG